MDKTTLKCHKSNMNKLLHVLHTCSTICPTIPVFSFCLHLNKIILEVLYLKNNKQTLPPVNSSLEKEGEGYIPLLKHSIFFFFFLFLFILQITIKKLKTINYKIIKFFHQWICVKESKNKCSHVRQIQNIVEYFWPKLCLCPECYLRNL